MKATFETYQKEKAIKQKLDQLGFYKSTNELYRMYLLSFINELKDFNTKIIYSQEMFENGIEPLFEKSDSYNDYIYAKEIDAVNRMLARLSLGGFGNDIEMFKS